ncbi:Crp/Fnr family transcriptional regulator [Hoeflea sp. BAL378]|uniref:Crp/Fnr family transcriptional regulator n=1 Tax=Hoeflea sp. BAL378 TaxID=1547437 RepID=UPI001FCCA775|nr:Crp/Fnr family transcriptional regulator [Hoeflea sp. BAL378]
MANEIRGDFDTRNKVIQSVRPDAVRFLESRSIVRRLTQGQTLYQEAEQFTHAIFPHEGVISLMAQMQDGRSVEKVSVGNEGFIGISFILGGARTISASIVQVPGYASWISIEDLDRAIAEYPCVRDAMMEYAKSLTLQLMESVACNSLHKAEQRISRWLLDAHDRVQSDTFQLTQDSVSQVLGLRRATVSSVCRALMAQGAIKYTRGSLTISDRDLLESNACECYDRIRLAFRRKDANGTALPY